MTESDETRKLAIKINEKSLHVLQFRTIFSRRQFECGGLCICSRHAACHYGAIKQRLNRKARLMQNVFMAKKIGIIKAVYFFCELSNYNALNHMGHFKIGVYVRIFFCVRNYTHILD